MSEMIGRPAMSVMKMGYNLIGLIDSSWSDYPTSARPGSPA
jgi:hypothetical protein